MLFGFIGGVAIAYVLSLVHVDQTIIAGVKDLTGIEIGSSGYYLLMGVAGGISRVALGGFITGLAVAFVFSLVKIDTIVIEGLKEWFKYDLSGSGYYLTFAILGAVISLLSLARTALKPVIGK